MRLAVLQSSGRDRRGADGLMQLERQIALQAPDLVVCPELFMTGYDRHADYAALAEPADGPFARAVADIARCHNAAIAYGYPERGDGCLYNAAALIGPDGRRLANHRKRLPSPGSFEEHVFTNGPAMSFADLGGWRLAIAICYEVEFPESIRQAARGGAHLVLVPTALGADWGVVSERVVPARAFENGIWLAYAGQTGEQAGLRFFGGSRIVGPLGETVAEAGQQETLLISEISRDRVESARARLPFLRDCAAL